jgi:quercetin dioxygenase-like cupin family protein
MQMRVVCQKWLWIVGLVLIIGCMGSDTSAQTAFQPEVKHLDQIHEFPINIPGIRAASLFKTSTADMILTHGEPGTKLHKHEVSDHFVYILKGRGEVRLGERKETVTVGDLILIPKGVPHSILKAGDTEFVFLAMSSPPLDQKDFVWLEK